MQVPLLVTDFLDRSARLFPAKTAVVDGPNRFSYAEFEARVHQLAHALLGLGIERGDRVCILSPNSHFFLESFYATAKTGIVLVPLNYRLTGADHEYILNHAGVKAVLVDWEYTGVVDEIRPNLERCAHFIVAKDSGETPDGWTDWEALIADAPREAPPRIDIGENDLVSLNYTSGTTARPKGVMMTHRNCYLNAYNLIAHLGVRHDDIELWTLPMFHCNGWGGVYALTGVGGTHVVLRAIDGKAIYDLIENEGVTFACMAPAVLRTILDYPDKAAHAIAHEAALHRRRRAAAGRVHRTARARARLGVPADLRAHRDGADPHREPTADHGCEREDWARRSRAGTPAIGVQIEVRDEHDQPVPMDGESVGEVCARANVVFEGYWEQPDQTAEAIRDGWFHTGDLGVWDAYGNVNIVDRKKDVIISGGENISSPEIEDALYQHAAVLECAVIGVPHEKWGETPKALVVLREGTAASEEELIAFCRDHLAHFKCPSSITFVPELPRTATGKLQKFKLREQYWEGSRRVN